MGSEDTDLMEEGGGGGEAKVPIGGTATPVTCSICFEAVSDSGGRSWAKLQCEHMFHLDCIGSAFNAKGSMQCPNCRKVEKGQWLYANGCRSCPELSIDDWPHEFFDLNYSEVPYGFHWCPFGGGLTRVSSSFEERELPSSAYHDLLGHHAIFTEHTIPTPPQSSLPPHSCPYFAYLPPLQPSSSNSIEPITDDPTFTHHHFSNNISTSHAFQDHHYQTWEPPSLRSSDTTQQSRSFPHPVLLSHGHGHRPGSSVMSAVPPYRSASPNMRLPMRRSSGTRAIVGPVGPVGSSLDRSNIHYVQQQESSLRNHFYAWERDRFAPFPLIPIERESSWWAPIHQASGNGPDSGARASSVWQSERSSAGENPQQGSLHPFI